MSLDTQTNDAQIDVQNEASSNEASQIEAPQNRADFWNGRSVFVTGATGIVGSWLVKELLKRRAHVIALIHDQDPNSELIRSGDLDRISIVSGALEDFWTLERAINRHEPDTVFHLAAQPIVDVAHRFPLQTFEANIRGSYNLLEVCRIHQQLVKRLVIASSDKAYGGHLNLPYTEDMQLQGRHPYEVSKSCTDLLAQCYSHTYHLPVGIVRCGNIYGGGDLNWSRIVPSAIRSILRNERPILRSDGTFLRDYIYVKDAVGAYMCLAENLERDDVRGEAFNFSPEVPVSVLELVQHIAGVMGRDDITPDIRNTARGEIPSQYLDAAKAQRILNWKLQYSMDEGLRETVEWYKNFLAAA